MIEKAVPKTFDEYVGQDKAKAALQAVLASTKKQIARLMANRSKDNMLEAAKYMPPSILLIGPPGYGKTRLAQIYAEEMTRLSDEYSWPIAKDNSGSFTKVWNGPGLPHIPYSFSSIEGKDITDSNILDHYLYYLQIQGILFIDEFQGIPRKMHQHFLRVMTEHSYQSAIADRLWQMNGYTLLGATTNEGRISRPLLERFKLPIIMEPYDFGNIGDIITHYASKMGYTLHPEALNILIDRSRDCPRTITQNMDMLFMLKEPSEITVQDAMQATELRGIGLHGLTTRDIKVLRLLERHQVLGAEILSEMTNFEDVKDYKVQERFLLTREYIMPSSKGRKLTPLGLNILKELPDIEVTIQNVG